MPMNLGNYTVDDAGNRTAETSVEGFGGERSEFAKKMEELARKQAAGAGLNAAAAAPKKSPYQLAMERLALDQARAAAANAARGGQARPTGFKSADMPPIKYIGGPGIIGGPTMDVMAMNYEQRQKFLPQGSQLDAAAYARERAQRVDEKGQLQDQAMKEELFKKAMQGDPTAIRLIQGGS